MSNQKNLTTVEHIANIMTGTFKDNVIFSDPIERDGVIVIPVAKIVYGLGGGKSNQSNEGGGGGLIARPVGYIEIKDGETHFRSIRDPSAYMPIIIASGIVVSLLLKRLIRLFRP